MTVMALADRHKLLPKILHTKHTGILLNMMDCYRLNNIMQGILLLCIFTEVKALNTSSPTVYFNNFN